MQQMNTTLVPITKENLPLFAKAAETFGLPRSVGWLRRCIFDPTVVEWTKDPVRGHMSVTEEGEIVAVQGYYYQPCYFRQKPVLGNTGCIMGSDAKCGEELLFVYDRNKETKTRAPIGISNCLASKRSLEISRRTGRMKVPAYDGATSALVGKGDLAWRATIAVGDKYASVV